MKLLPNLRIVLALGRIAFIACLRAFDQRSGQRLRAKFAHGGRYDFGPELPLLAASYHPSPRNTNTGRLSKEGLVGVLLDIRGLIGVK